MPSAELSDLPDELVLAVLARLGARDQLALAAAARRYRALAAALPKRVRLAGDTGPAPWRWLRSRAAADTLVELSCVRASPSVGRDWGPTAWLARLGRLEKFAARFCMLPARVVERLPRGLVELRLHQVHGRGIFRTADVAALTGLRRLSVTFAPFAAWDLVFVDELPPALDALELLRCPQLMVRDGIHGVRSVRLHAHDGIAFFASGGTLAAATAGGDGLVAAPPPANAVTGCERLALRTDSPIAGLDRVLPTAGLRRLDLSCTGLTAVPRLAEMTQLEKLMVDFDTYEYSHADLAHVRDATIDARVRFVILDCQRANQLPGQRRVVRLNGRHVAWAGLPRRHPPSWSWDDD